jgi:hypothetical protein
MRYRMSSAKRLWLGLAAACLGLLFAFLSTAAAAPVQRTGVFKVWTKLDASPVLPNGTSVDISVTIDVVDGVYSNQTVISGSAIVWGGKTNLLLSFPYIWTVSSAATTVKVTARINGDATSGIVNYSDFGSFSTTLALPANGATTLVTFSGGI